MSRVAALCLIAVALLCAARPASATTARDLSGRIRIDGYTTDFTDSEVVFGKNADGTPQEASDDSKWGVNDDLNQIRVTWDARFLYVAGEGRIWGNNMILFLDTVKGQGLARMDSLNSWRRNFFFDSDTVSGFEPDLFVATWDGNTAPHLITWMSGQTVHDNDGTAPASEFSASASFAQGNTGRSMEAAIPWATVFRGEIPAGRTIPVGARIKICGVITGGGDGTGGPDAAPDNGQGLSSDASARAVIDNYAIISLDERTDVIGGAVPGPAGGDGVPDLGVEPISRITFRYTPPIFPKQFCVKAITLDRPALMPDRGEHIRYDVTLDPFADPRDTDNGARKITLSAYVYDLRGRIVRTLYTSQVRPVLAPNDAAYHVSDAWDGRDQSGTIVPPGIYVLRIVTEPGVCRALRSFVVVR